MSFLSKRISKNLALIILGICALLLVGGSAGADDGNRPTAEKTIPIPDNLKKGLIAYYPFDDKATDLSGENNHGKIKGPNRDNDVSGERRGSYRWDGGRDKITLPIDINVGALPQVTLCAWVYPLSYRGMTIISNDDGRGDRKIFAVQNKAIRGEPWLWCCSDGNGGFIGKTPKEFKKWVFLVATYDENTQTAAIYVDGVKTSGKTKMDMGAPSTLIGAKAQDNDGFDALIDEVRIYNRILSRAEIKSLRELKPVIFDPVKAELEKEYYRLAKQDNLIVRSSPSVNGKSLGHLAEGDTLDFIKRVAETGTERKSWLKIKFEGKTGYVHGKYINEISVGSMPQSELEKKIRKWARYSNWQFWVVILLLMGISFGGSFGFGAIDMALNRLTGNDYEGEVAFFPLVTGFAGGALAILMVIWQKDINYYLIDNFTFWPAGYGFAVWAVWGVVAICAAVFIGLVIESLFCGNIIHGLLRIVLQIVLAVITLVSVFIFTIVVILFVILLIVAIGALYALIMGNTEKRKKEYY